MVFLQRFASVHNAFVSFTGVREQVPELRYRKVFEEWMPRTKPKTEAKLKRQARQTPQASSASALASCYRAWFAIGISPASVTSFELV